MDDQNQGIVGNFTLSVFTIVLITVLNPVAIAIGFWIGAFAGLVR